MDSSAMESEGEALDCDENYEESEVDVDDFDEVEEGAW